LQDARLFQSLLPVLSSFSLSPAPWQPGSVSS
jgi:hypothetical protein